MAWSLDKMLSTRVTELLLTGPTINHLRTALFALALKDDVGIFVYELYL